MDEPQWTRRRGRGGIRKPRTGRLIKATAGCVTAFAVAAVFAIVLPSAASAQNPAAEAKPPIVRPKPHRPVVRPAPAKNDAPAGPLEQFDTAAPAGTKSGALDLAFGAFQRGYFLTAFSLATQRAEQDNDKSAMTLLGELYANGYGVPQDDAKAADWYKLAADRGDPNAMFALAMFRLAGRAGPRDREASAKWLAAAAKLGHPTAAYDLALLYMEGQLFPRDFGRAAELLRVAASAGNAEAQYALGTLYKQGRGVPKDPAQAVQLWGLAAIAENTDAEVEYAIALFNGDGVAKNETAAIALFRKAAMKGDAIAQDRLAHILAAGRGVPADPVEATKWHLISKARGETDLSLDDFVNSLDPAKRAAGEKAAKAWLDQLKPAKS